MHSLQRSIRVFTVFLTCQQLLSTFAFVIHPTSSTSTSLTFVPSPLSSLSLTLKSTKSSENESQTEPEDKPEPKPEDEHTFQPLYLHHAAIRTRNIENAIKFYSLFGFEIEHKFRAGPARAAWLINNINTSTSTSTSNNTIKGQNDVASRIELIEVPSYILNEKENTIKKSIDLIKNESLLGLNHYALDVTSFIKQYQHKKQKSDNQLTTTTYYGLDQFINDIEQESIAKYNKKLNIAVSPKQQVIGNQVYELAFLYDADGSVMELVRYIKEIDLKLEDDGQVQVMDSGWEPWDGKGFVGKE